MARDHSLPRNFELHRRICLFPQNFYVFTEFCGIWYWTVIRGQIRHILMEFRPPYCMYTWFHHEIHDCHSGFDGRNIENIKLSLSEILPVHLVERLYLQLLATNTAYLVGFRGHRKLITICGKFAAVSRGIWQTGPRNLDKFAAENCGPYWCCWPSYFFLSLSTEHVVFFVCVCCVLAVFRLNATLIFSLIIIMNKK